MLLTVAIPTYRRQRLLEGTLETLARQTLNREQYVLLIIDNGMSESIREIARKYGARYVAESQLGLQHARNRAMQAATTPWVLFLDDDIRAPVDLLEKFHRRLVSADYDGLGGKYTHWFITPPARWLYRYYEKPLCPSSRTDFGELRTNEFLFGGIMAIRKNAWKEVGGFLPGLSMIGERVGRAGEDEFQRRLRERGFRLFYDPNIEFDHLVQPYKCSFRGQLRLAWASGRDGMSRLDDAAINQQSYIRDLMVITFYSLPFNVARWLFKPGYYWQNALIDTVGKYYFVAGQILALTLRNR